MTQEDKELLLKVYVVFQQGSFNPHHEEKRIKGVFSSYQKAEECISNLSYGGYILFNNLF